MSIRSEFIRLFNEFMSNSKKITELPAAGALTGAELIEAVQGGVNVETTTQAIANLGGGGGGSGTVTSVSVTTANGVSGSVATATTTPAITLTLGAITPSSVVSSGGVSGSNLSGTNTGDQTNISGNAATVTTNANLTGPITSTGNATAVGWVTPEMYGAVGDGVTNDKAALQAAIDTLQPVFIQEKTYLIGSTVNIPPYSTIFGMGKKSVILSSTGITMFTITGGTTGNNSTIKDVTFQGNLTASQIGISAIGSGAVPVAPFVTGVKISGCAFDSLATGVYTLNSFNPTTYEGAYQITGSSFSYNTNAGVEFGLSGEYNLVVGNVFYANNYGLYLIGGNQNVTGNRITNNTNAFEMIGGSNNGKHNIEANTINHNVTYSVHATSVSNGFSFKNNNVYSSGQFYVQSCTDVVIDGNTFSQATVSFSLLTNTNLHYINNHHLINTTFSITGTAPRFFNNSWQGSPPTTANGLNLLFANLTTIRGTTTTGNVGPLRIEDSSSNLLMLVRDDGRTSIGGAGSPSALSPFSSTGTFSKSGASIGFECSGNSYVVHNTNQSGAGVSAAGLVINGTHAVTSGSTTFGGVRVDHVLNQTGTSSGDYTMFDDNTTLTAMLGNLYGVRIKQTTAKNGFGLTTPTATLHVVGTTKLDGSVTLPTAGNGVLIKEGTNATMGVATLVAGTVTVNTTKVTSTSRIFLTVQGGTLTNVGSTYVSDRNGGTSFTISSTNILDTADVAWVILEPAP